MGSSLMDLRTSAAGIEGPVLAESTYVPAPLRLSLTLQNGTAPAFGDYQMPTVSPSLTAHYMPPGNTWLRANALQKGCTCCPPGDKARKVKATPRASIEDGQK